MSIRPQPFLCFLMMLVSPLAYGQTLQTIETFKGPDPPTCTTPTASNSFVSSDVIVNAYLFLAGMNTNGGDVVKLNWYDPKGNWDVVSSWNATTSGYTGWCFSTNLNIAQWIAPNGFGVWQMQVVVNGNLVGSRVSFSVTAPTSTTAGPPNIT